MHPSTLCAGPVVDGDAPYATPCSVCNCQLIPYSFPAPSPTPTTTAEKKTHTLPPLSRSADSAAPRHTFLLISNSVAMSTQATAASVLASVVVASLAGSRCEVVPPAGVPAVAVLSAAEALAGWCDPEGHDSPGRSAALCLSLLDRATAAAGPTEAAAARMLSLALLGRVAEDVTAARARALPAHGRASTATTVAVAVCPWFKASRHWLRLPADHFMASLRCGPTAARPVSAALAAPPASAAARPRPPPRHRAPQPRCRPPREVPSDSESESDSSSSEEEEDDDDGDEDAKKKGSRPAVVRRRPPARADEPSFLDLAAPAAAKSASPRGKRPAVPRARK